MNDIFSSNDEYIPVEISNIGYADHLGLEGFLILKSIDLGAYIGIERYAF